MQPDVARDLSDSAHDFLRVVWPVISSACGNGELQPVEAVSPKQFEKQLDILSGIDAWQIIDGKGIRGISSRIQWMKNGGWFQTFTIRKSRSNGKPTEWDKRTRFLSDWQSGFLRPALLVHAYIATPRRHGNLLYVCMCRADELFKLATEDMVGVAWYEETNPQDGNTFAVFPVSDLKSLGVRVFDWCSEQVVAA